MGTLDIVLIIGSLVAVTLIVLWRRADRTPTATPPADAPAGLLVWAIGLLPADRAAWGQAMVGELGQLQHRSKRWRFVLGCLVATVLLPARRSAGRFVAALASGSALACAALVAYSMLRFPAILTNRGTWPALATFSAVLVGFALLARVLVRRRAPARLALIGGLGTAAVWLIFGYAAVTYAPARPALSLLLVALPIAPLIVGAATRGGRTATAARQAALLCAIVTGLVLFLTLASVALLRAGGPYDPGQVRDFPSSSFPDIATYAVSDNLGTAMSLLLLASTLTATLGCAAATIAGRFHRTATTL